MVGHSIKYLLLLALAAAAAASSSWAQVQAQVGPLPCEPKAGLLLPDLVTEHLLDLITLIQLTREDSPAAQARMADPSSSKFPSIQVFQDSNDGAIVASVRNTCMVVFQATNFENVLDIVQLLNWGTDKIGVCTFRAGMAGAYYSSYYADFVSAVDSCMARPNKMQPTPKLLLGGHSQGGAIAVAASVDLQRYDPTVVTLGAVRSLVKPCNATNPTKHYRFVNAINGAYDWWTTVLNRNGQHIGQPIYLDPTSHPDHLAAYTYLNDDSNPEPADTFNHDPDIYWLAISQLFHQALATSCHDEIVIGGWQDGHHCNAAPECEGRYCVEHTCYSFP